MPNSDVFKVSNEGVGAYHGPRGQQAVTVSDYSHDASVIGYYNPQNGDSGSVFSLLALLLPHTLADTSGLGQFHTTEGLTAGMHLRATAATAARFMVPLVGDFAASAESILIGRGQGSGAGPLQEITLGANLSMTGTVLSASGSGSAVDHDHTAGGDGGVLTNDNHDGFVNIQAIATPANPSANAMRLFTRINGSNIEFVSQGPLGGECILCVKPNVDVAAELQLNWVE